MKKSLLVVLAAVTSASVALAGQPGNRKPDKAATSGRLLPSKGATSGNSCAAYGAGFVKVEGTDTCMRIGGAVGIGAGTSTGSR
jgi:hypothetical protein